MRLPLLAQLDSTRIGRFEFCWYIHSFLTELVLIYPVFGIMMLESVSNFELSLLFVVWTVVAIPLEVPFGTLADRFDRRHLLAIAGLIECFCFVLWLVMPEFWLLGLPARIRDLGSCWNPAIRHLGVAYPGCPDQPG